jgi:hypothetical protein
VIVHGLAHVRAALAPGLAVTLLSAPGAALYAGCGFWRALMERARQEFPDVAMMDVLDCADGSGQALGALRIGQRLLVLERSAPGWDAVAAIATKLGGRVLAAPPPAIDLARRGAERRLTSWLHNPPGLGDSGAGVG